ncbi:hypothetical protein [Xenorhabdus cabanillasii]
MALNNNPRGCPKVPKKAKNIPAYKLTAQPPEFHTVEEELEYLRALIQKKTPKQRTR